MAEKNASIVIKKIKKGGGHGHHGGAWKVAYADFVTAMMCFFLVMWLMGSDEEIKASIEHYFNHPNTPYHAGRDPASDVAHPQGEMEGSGDSILRGVNGFFEDVLPQTPTRGWEVEHGNLRVKLEQVLAETSAFAYQSNADAIRFSVPSQDLFEGDSANLKPAATPLLDKVAAQIQQYPGFWNFTSHSSDRRISSDSYSSSWDLTSARASIILRYFVERHHLDPRRVSAAGYADQRPLTDNNSTQARQTNERVDFILSRSGPTR